MGILPAHNDTLFTCVVKNTLFEKKDVNFSKAANNHLANRRGIVSMQKCPRQNQGHSPATFQEI
jgi:hypothetical protein